MTTLIDKTYRKEKLLDWEFKSLTKKYSIFSFSKKSTWLTLGKIILGLSIFGFIVPFIPPRYGWGNWTPASTSDEFQQRLMNFWILVPIIIVALYVNVYIRNKIDLKIEIKWIANFKVTNVLKLGNIKILFMNGWRPFCIKAKQPYFKSVFQGQIITVKRTCTFRLINYYIRDEKTYNVEQNKSLVNS